MVQLPDQETLGAVVAAIFAGGANTSIKATAIMTAAEAVDMFKKAGRWGYRPRVG